MLRTRRLRAFVRRIIGDWDGAPCCFFIGMPSRWVLAERRQVNEGRNGAEGCLPSVIRSIIVPTPVMDRALVIRGCPQINDRHRRLAERFDVAVVHGAFAPRPLCRNAARPLRMRPAAVGRVGATAPSSLSSPL